MKRSKIFGILILAFLFSMLSVTEIISLPQTAHKGPMSSETCIKHKATSVTCGGESGVCTEQIMCSCAGS